MTAVVVAERYTGPPRAGQGGYVAGLLASHVGNPAEVTLRRPAPLARPLTIESTAAGARLVDGAEVVAEATTIDPFDIGDVPVIRYEAAAAASAAAVASFADTHPFPGCFGCGPDHPDGLHLLAGRVDEPTARDGDVYAVPWVPADDLADDDGTIRPELVWAAIDCPTFAPLFAERATAVLGRLAVDVRGRVRLGHRYVITSWRTATDGRKHHVAGALSSDMGGALAIARATWIEVDAATFAASTA